MPPTLVPSAAAARSEASITTTHTPAPATQSGSRAAAETDIGPVSHDSPSNVPLPCRLTLIAVADTAPERVPFHPRGLTTGSFSGIEKSRPSRGTITNVAEPPYAAAGKPLNVQLSVPHSTTPLT